MNHNDFVLVPRIKELTDELKRRKKVIDQAL